ncbi:MAG: tetratricopeptide repeat-containing glycosyltransferase [Panacagrimonas sp.]
MKTPSAGHKKICLNMIVKNEAHVIQRCLASVRPFIDAWVIVDTGSTDGTQNVIRDALKHLPGRLHERPWKNFGHNRSEAIQLAAGVAEYLLIIDADDFLVTPKGFRFPDLRDPAYSLAIHHGPIRYRRRALIREALGWRYVGVLHEYLESTQPVTGETPLEGVHIGFGADGGRSQVDQRVKYARDAEVLEQGLRDEPDNSRYVFYLAQSYRDSEQFQKSLAAYDRRATMGGFAEEVYCALLQGARISRRLGLPAAEIVDRYLRAFESRPTRAEALGELALYCRESGPRWALAYMFAQRAVRIPMPSDVLFLEPAWYEWRSLDEYAIAAYWVGEWEECRETCEHLLSTGLLPQEQRERVLGNLNHAKRKLGADSPE